MQTKSRKRHAPNPKTEARKAEIELAVPKVNNEAPDFVAFINRWGKRYSENNLKRLWVQAPNATVLHKFGTWRGMGRQVRTGENAIWLRIPRTGHDENKVTERNPDGSVFFGAPWMAFFDYSQTDPIGEHVEAFGLDTDEATLAGIKKLRAEAVALHPDTTGKDTAKEFIAAWARYETARDAAKPKNGR